MENFEIKRFCSFSSAYAEQIEDCKEAWHASFTRWSTIEFLAKLPIPKLGFGGLTIAALVVPFYNFAVLEIYKGLNHARALASQSLLDVPVLEVSSRAKTIFALMVVLIVLAITHNILRPSEISQYNLVQWKREHTGSTLKYRSIDRQNGKLAPLVLSLYVAIFGSLFFLYIQTAAKFAFL